MIDRLIRLVRVDMFSRFRGYCSDGNGCAAKLALGGLDKHTRMRAPGDQVCFHPGLAFGAGDKDM